MKSSVQNSHSYVRWTGEKFVWASRGRASYVRDMKVLLESPVTRKEWSPARECVFKATEADWWDWLKGSRPFFWRWPAHTIRWARDGQPHYQTQTFPKFTKAQQAPKTPEDRIMVWRKLSKVRERLYIDVGLVLSLMHMFYVPKGDSDVRMVYNGTSSGINDCLFAPHFGLPTILYILRSLRPGYYQADMDVGEMFPNFILGEQLRPYSGVDVTHIKTRAEDLKHHLPEPLTEMPEWEKGRTRRWERWTRNWMGLRDSPYRSIQMAIIAKERSYGDRKATANPFQWEQVVLNLPGTPKYDTSFPWVFKVREDGHIASDIFLYVDDGRPTGFSEEQCWQASRRFCSMCSYLGIQDASRKRTTPSQTPGPWAGSVVHTKDELVALVSQKKWDKTKSMIRELKELLGARDDGQLPRKRLEQIRGFLIYVSRTYDWMPPYLKGLHLTIDSWREGRLQNGWKAKKAKGKFVIWEWEGEQWLDVSPEDFACASQSPMEAPEYVRAVPRFKRDVAALETLFAADTPAVSRLRPNGSLGGYYLVGDASGKGFGSALWGQDNIHWESGNYAVEYQNKSSNFREADNLVSRMERLADTLELHGKEVFILTDNSAFEGTYYKGHSSSEKLSDIILRLRLVQQRAGCLVHVIHIAGTRMKAAGIDGLSRGDLLEGMMQSTTDPWRFIPLAQSANERMPQVLHGWINSWWSDLEGKPWCGAALRLLTPTDWFTLSEVNQPRLWMPPPAAMTTVLELFNDDRLVRPHFPHVFVVPRLMTHLWRKQLSKDADLIFSVACGPEFWPKEMHEPLIILIVLPLHHVDRYHGPWLVKGTEAAERTQSLLTRGFKIWNNYVPGELHELDGEMSRMWSTQEEWSRSVLFEFLAAQRNFPPVQECLVRGLLRCTPKRPVPGTTSTRRRRRNRSRSERRSLPQTGQGRGSLDGDSV